VGKMIAGNEFFLKRLRGDSCKKSHYAFDIIGGFFGNGEPGPATLGDCVRFYESRSSSRFWRLAFGHTDRDSLFWS